VETTLNVLSLGAGVQSTALYLMAARGELGVKLDAAIFADTQDEPKKVYEHLEWLKSQGGPPILVGTAGKLSEHLAKGINSTGGRFASIPAFTTQDAGAHVGITRRQCSKEYKTDVIGRVLRHELLGLKKGQAPRGVAVNQFIGISLDEAGRAARMQRNIPAPKYLKRRFYLIENNITRAGCVDYNSLKVPHEVPRSACKFCPYHTDYEWHRQQTDNPEEFADSCAVDSVLRDRSTVIARAHTHTAYLHRSCRPLGLVQFDPTPPKPRQVQLSMNFTAECEGVCGV
jgi:hypothetical protein